MDLLGFENWFKSRKNKNGNDYSAQAIHTRIRDLESCEEILGNVDECMNDEEVMYEALLRLGKNDNPAHQRLQTALRRYWEFKNGNDFPKIKDYEKKTRLGLR